MRLRIPLSVVVSTGLLTIRPPYPSFRRKPESSLFQTFLDPGFRRGDGLGDLALSLTHYLCQSYGAVFVQSSTKTPHNLGPN